jgi:hypothetical protein
LDEEIRSHIRMATQDRIRQGQNPEEARAEVVKEFGNVALTMENTRSVWGGQWLEQLAFDLRYAARSLARTPGFAVAAVLSLAIGIGATTALFSVLQHVTWQPLPYRDPDKLAIVWNLDPRLANPQSAISFPDWQDWRSQSKGFAGLAMFRNRPGFLQGLAKSEQGICRPGDVPQSSGLSTGGRPIAAVGTTRGLGGFPASAGSRAGVGPLLE